MEADGTKFACAIGTNPKDLRDDIRFDITTPDETINRAIEYLQAQNLRSLELSGRVASISPVSSIPAWG
jgi:hypothetical protein